MSNADIFAEYDRVAAKQGWDALGQPELDTRRYGHGRKTVRIYATAGHLTRVSATYEGRLMESVRRVAQLRPTALAWLEHRR